jgi:hypothetical protein
MKTTQAKKPATSIVSVKLDQSDREGLNSLALQ